MGNKVGGQKGSTKTKEDKRREQEDKKVHKKEQKAKKKTSKKSNKKSARGGHENSGSDFDTDLESSHFTGADSESGVFHSAENLSTTSPYLDSCTRSERETSGVWSGFPASSSRHPQVLSSRDFRDGFSLEACIPPEIARPVTYNTDTTISSNSGGAVGGNDSFGGGGGSSGGSNPIGYRCHNSSSGSIKSKRSNSVKSHQTPTSARYHQNDDAMSISTTSSHKSGHTSAGGYCTPLMTTPIFGRADKLLSVSPNSGYSFSRVHEPDRDSMDIVPLPYSSSPFDPNPKVFTTYNPTVITKHSQAQQQEKQQHHHQYFHKPIDYSNLPKPTSPHPQRRAFSPKMTSAPFKIISSDDSSSSTTTPIPQRRAAALLTDLFRSNKKSKKKSGSEDDENINSSNGQNIDKDDDDGTTAPKRSPIWKTWERSSKKKSSKSESKLSIFGTARKTAKSNKSKKEEKDKGKGKETSGNSSKNKKKDRASDSTLQDFKMEDDSSKNSNGSDSAKNQLSPVSNQATKSSTSSCENGSKSNGDSELTQNRNSSPPVAKSAAFCIMRLEELERNIEKTIKEKFPDAEPFLLRKTPPDDVLRGSKSLPTTPSLKKKLYVKRDVDLDTDDATSDLQKLSAKLDDLKSQSATRYYDETFEELSNGAKSPVIYRRFGARTRHASISPKILRAKTAAIYNSPSEMERMAECKEEPYNKDSLSKLTSKSRGKPKTPVLSRKNSPAQNGFSTKKSICKIDTCDKNNVGTNLKTQSRPLVRQNRIDGTGEEEGPMYTNTCEYNKFTEATSSKVVVTTDSAVFGSISPKLKRHLKDNNIDEKYNCNKLTQGEKQTRVGRCTQYEREDQSKTKNQTNLKRRSGSLDSLLGMVSGTDGMVGSNDGRCISQHSAGKDKQSREFSENTKSSKDELLSLSGTTVSVRSRVRTINKSFSEESSGNFRISSRDATSPSSPGSDGGGYHQNRFRSWSKSDSKHCLGDNGDERGRGNWSSSNAHLELSPNLARKHSADHVIFGTAVALPCRVYAPVSSSESSSTKLTSPTMSRGSSNTIINRSPRLTTHAPTSVKETTNNVKSQECRKENKEVDFRRKTTEESGGGVGGGSDGIRKNLVPGENNSLDNTNNSTSVQVEIHCRNNADDDGDGKGGGVDGGANKGGRRGEVGGDANCVRNVEHLRYVSGIERIPATPTADGKSSGCNGGDSGSSSGKNQLANQDLKKTKPLVIVRGDKDTNSDLRGSEGGSEHNISFSEGECVDSCNSKEEQDNIRLNAFISKGIHHYGSGFENNSDIDGSDDVIRGSDSGCHGCSYDGQQLIFSQHGKNYDEHYDNVLSYDDDDDDDHNIIHPDSSLNKNLHHHYHPLDHQHQKYQQEIDYKNEEKFGKSYSVEGERPSAVLKQPISKIISDMIHQQQHQHQQQPQQQQQQKKQQPSQQQQSQLQPDDLYMPQQQQQPQRQSPNHRHRHHKQNEYDDVTKYQSDSLANHNDVWEYLPVVSREMTSSSQHHLHRSDERNTFRDTDKPSCSFPVSSENKNDNYFDRDEARGTQLDSFSTSVRGEHETNISSEENGDSDIERFIQSVKESEATQILGEKKDQATSDFGGSPIQDAAHQPPPPSPSALNKLIASFAEEEEEDDDDDYDNDFNDRMDRCEMNQGANLALTRQNEMKEFTDRVIHRLSDLLGSHSGNDLNDDDDDVFIDESTNNLLLLPPSEFGQTQSEKEEKDECVDSVNEDDSRGFVVGEDGETSNTGDQSIQLDYFMRSSMKESLISDRIKHCRFSTSSSLSTSSSSSSSSSGLFAPPPQSSSVREHDGLEGAPKMKTKPDYFVFPEGDNPSGYHNNEDYNGYRRAQARSYHSDDDVARGGGIPEYYDDRPLWSRQQKPPGQISAKMASIRRRERRERWLKKRRRNKTDLLSNCSSEIGSEQSLQFFGESRLSLDDFEEDEEVAKLSSLRGAMGSGILTSPKYAKPIMPFFGSREEVKSPDPIEEKCTRQNVSSSMLEGSAPLPSRCYDDDTTTAISPIKSSEFNRRQYNDRNNSELRDSSSSRLGQTTTREHATALEESQSSITDTHSSMKIPGLEETFDELMSVQQILEDLQERTPASASVPGDNTTHSKSIRPDSRTRFMPLTAENIRSMKEQFRDYGSGNNSNSINNGRHSRMSNTNRTESDLDIYSEYRDDASTDSNLYADDEGDDDVNDPYTTADDELDEAVGGGDDDDLKDYVVSCTFYNSNAFPQEGNISHGYNSGALPIISRITGVAETTVSRYDGSGSRLSPCAPVMRTSAEDESFDLSRSTLVCTNSNMQSPGNRRTQRSFTIGSPADTNPTSRGSSTYTRSNSAPGASTGNQLSVAGAPGIINSDDEFWDGRATFERSYQQLEEAAGEVSSTFQNAREQMMDIQHHLQALRRQMEGLQEDLTSTSYTLTPDISAFDSK